MSKIKIKKGDIVEVIAGNDKGKSGKVLMVISEKEKALVEGVNFVKKHIQKTEDNPQGGVVEREAPLAISNIKQTTK